jgi:hypothetical protein
MSISLMLALLVSAGTAPPCAAVDGWNAGRHGKPAATECSAADYAEAHKLGQALHELLSERASIEAGLKSLSAEEQGKQRRRQRQIDNDVEAIYGVATIRSWPYDAAGKLEQPR